MPICTISTNINDAIYFVFENYRTIPCKQFKILTALACFGSLNCTNAKPLKWVKTNNKLFEEYSTWLITATCLKMNRSRNIILRTLVRNANISVSHLQLTEIIPFQEEKKMNLRRSRENKSRIFEQTKHRWQDDSTSLF